MRRVIVNVPASRASFETVGPDDAMQDSEAVEMAGGPKWEGVLTIEEEMTGDGRMFTAGAVRWETLPVPLRWVKFDEGEHLGAVVVGRIDEVWRDGNKVMGRGVFDDGSQEGREAMRQVAEGLTPGVSVDLDDVSFEIRIRSELMEPEEMAGHDELGDKDKLADHDKDGMTTVLEMSPDDEIMVTTDARLRAATIVATPAFADARLYMMEEEAAAAPKMVELSEVRRMETVTASAVAAALRPPKAWFADPKLSGPTSLTVTDDGRVYGHLAAWGTCHTGFPSECVQPPSSATNYAYFRTGSIRTEDGSEVAVGRVTLDTTHAGRRLGATDTSAHYEHTGVAVADVAAGEDAYGIWIAGALRPGVTDEQVRVLKASPLSGDWRRVGGQLELVAALAVNSPGFPIPRALVAGGAVQSLQSTGVVAAMPDGDRETLLASVDVEVLRRLLEREKAQIRQEKEAAAAAKRRVLVASASARIDALRG